MDSEQVLLAGLVGALLVISIVIVRRKGPKLPPEPPNPYADSPGVSATLAVLGPDLAPGGPAAWLSDELGGERPAVEALIGSLQPGLPQEGPFEVNRLVAHAPVRLTGHVVDGAPTITSLLRLDASGQH